MLTKREYEVVALLLSGLTPVEAAARLDLSVPSISNTLRRAGERLPGLAACVAFAREIHKAQRRTAAA